MANYLSAVGIVVSDLKASTVFYTDQLGMVVQQEISLSTMDEVILGFEGVRGASVILMQYTDGSNPDCKDLPGKLVFNITDVKATMEAVRAANGVIHKEAEEYEMWNGSIIGLVKDPDGYLIELMQKPPKR